MNGTKQPMPADIELGGRIRATRNERRVSQTQLANALSVTFQQVQKYEKGVNRIGIGRVGKIAEYLGVPMARLLPQAGAADDSSLGYRMTSSQKGCRLACAFLALDSLGQQRLADLAEWMAGERNGPA